MSLSAVPLDEPICPTLRRLKKIQSSWFIKLETYCPWEDRDGNSLYAARKDMLYNSDLQLLTGKLHSKANTAFLCFSNQKRKQYLLCYKTELSNILYCHSQCMSHVAFPAIGPSHLLRSCCQHNAEAAKSFFAARERGSWHCSETEPRWPDA